MPNFKFKEDPCMILAGSLWCLIAAIFLIPALTHAQTPVQVASKRAITGAPPLFESQPDPDIPGRFVSFMPSGCALSFGAKAVRGLAWTGACVGGRMHGRGMVIGYDYEQQPIFVFEGYIERGLRNSGVMHEPERKDGLLIGRRTEIVGSVLQPHTDVPFLDMPRTYLLALDDWSRQTDGKDLLASLGATWAPTSKPSASTAPSNELSSAQIASCTREIQELQVASQRWTGNVNDTAARLGRMQKDLFVGRCAGHPEARAYIAGADKMIGYGANADAGNGRSLPPLASSGSTGRSGSPDPSRSRKVHNPAADAKGCTQLIQGRERGVLSPISGNLTFVNNCSTAVEFFWCSDDECARGSGNTWTIRAGGSWPVDGTNVRWGACRGRDSGGFDKGSQGQRYTCPNLTW